jgi:hypothetical protein
MLKFIITLLLLSGYSSLKAQYYTIKFYRPNARGVLTHKSVKAIDNNITLTMIDNNPAQTQEDIMEVEMEAEAETIKRNNDKKQKFKYKIINFNCTHNKQSIEAISNGSIIIAENINENTEFSFADGKQIPDEIKKYLRMVISVSSDPHDDDKAFGTRDKKRVGDDWPINKKFAVSKLGMMGIKVDKTDISGSTILNGIEKDQGNDCLSISVKMDIHDLIGIPMPPDFKVTKSLMNCEMAGLLPVDLKKEGQKSIENFNTEIIAVGNIPTNEKVIPVTIVVRMTHRSESIMTPVLK